MNKQVILDTLLAPTRAKGVASGGMAVGFGYASAQTAPQATAEQIQQVVETMLFLNPSEWTMVAAILSSIWMVVCIAKAFGMGGKTLQFLAFLGRILSQMGKAPNATPPEIIVPTIDKEKEDGKAK